MAFRYSYAVVSRIPDSFANGKHGINLDQARREHENFVEILRELGLDVLEMEAEERHPECTKVDDTAIIINNTALMCSPAGTHRQGEVNLIRTTLKKELGLKVSELCIDGASVEGSDVLFTGKEIFVGISGTTNEAGAQSVARAFPEYPTTVVRVHAPPNRPTACLKDLICMAGSNVIAVGQSDAARRTLKEVMTVATYTYRLISLPEDIAANCLYVNGSLIHLSDRQIPQSYGMFENKIDYNRVQVEMPELCRVGAPISKLALLVGKFRRGAFVSTLS